MSKCRLIVIFLKTFVPSMLFFGFLIVFTEMISNSRGISLVRHVLEQHLIDVTPDPTASEIAGEIDKLGTKFDLYNQLLSQYHLNEGMVVNRSVRGEVLDQCDSLLFSTIRFVALKKMGYEEDAANAWSAITRSHTLDGWKRHPSCPESVSRDMLLGVFLGLSQRPPDYQQHLVGLLDSLQRGEGYFSNGPFYVSYLTPGMAESLRRMSRVSDIETELPAVVDLGFSTIEFNGMYLEKGYRSHLVALQVWLEMEMRDLFHARGWYREPRSAIWEMANWASYFTLEDPFKQRLEWISYELYTSNPDNLFYKWLWLKNAGLMSTKIASELRRELLASPSFPETHLPRDCDRKADYLWQRDSATYKPYRHCTRQFSGTDFLWMAALLQDSE